MNAIYACRSKPLTILAVDAPVMRDDNFYEGKAVMMLAKKTWLVMEIAQQLRAPRIFSGLLGGGAFRGNRPLVLLLHLLLQEAVDDPICVMFHYPIFWSFSQWTIEQLQDAVLIQADNMMQMLRDASVHTFEEALEQIITWKLPTSHDDGDLSFQVRPYHAAPEHQRRHWLGNFPLADIE